MYHISLYMAQFNFFIFFHKHVRFYFFTRLSLLQINAKAKNILKKELYIIIYLWKAAFYLRHRTFTVLSFKVDTCFCTLSTDTDITMKNLAVTGFQGDIVEHAAFHLLFFGERKKFQIHFEKLPGCHRYSWNFDPNLIVKGILLSKHPAEDGSNFERIK